MELGCAAHEPPRIRFGRDHRRRLLRLREDLLGVASADRGFSFKQVHAGCGGGLKQQYVCLKDGKEVGSDVRHKAYTLPSGATVTFTPEELKELEADRSDSLEIVEFIPRGAVDVAHIGDRQYLGPDAERGADGYALLVDALRATGTVGLGRLQMKGRERLALVDVYGERGLVLREVHYADAVRSFDEIELPGRDASAVAEVARRSLVAAVERKRRPTFDVSGHADLHPGCVLQAAERKLATMSGGKSVGVPVAMNEAARKRREKGKGSAGGKGKTGRKREPVKGPASVRSLPVEARAAAGDERPSETMKSSR